MCWWVAFLAGCGGGTQKHEITVKIEPSAESAAVQEDVKVGDDAMDRLRDEAMALPDAKNNDDAKDAIRRLQTIQEEFLRRVKQLDSKESAAWRRKLLEGKTFKDLAIDHRERPVKPPATP